MNSDRKKIKKMIIELSKIIDESPNVPENYIKRARFYSLQKDFDNALIDVENAIKLKPCESDFYFQRGEIFFRKSDFQLPLLTLDSGRMYFATLEEAITDYLKSLELNSENSSARCALDYCRHKKETWLKAVNDPVLIRYFKGLIEDIVR